MQPHALSISEALARIASRIGPAHVLADDAAMAAYAFDWRRKQESRPLAVLRPGSTAEVAETVAICAAAGLGIVPQGGNTGLVGGTVVPPGEASVLLKLGRLDRIRSLDPAGFTLVAEAGCILAHIQAAAESVDRLFPLSLGAEGTCQLGGNLSSNAGGILTLRYGNARDLVLGLEVVLADGRVWEGLRTLRKDNTGYDLKQLFLGAEGTLGVITAASLKLFPRPRQVETVLAALPSPAAAVDLLAALRTETGDGLAAAELMPRFAIDGAASILGDPFDPLDRPAPWYLLLELTSGLAGGHLRTALETVLASALEAGTVQDAAIAASAAQRARFWRLREGLPEIGRKLDGVAHHDVSVPVARIPDLIGRGLAAVERIVPGCRPFPFGHVGDGNIHFNIGRPPAMAKAEFLALAPGLTDAVHGLVLELGGSVSAEHGIGNVKVAELARIKPPVELELMHRIKAVLDPHGLMNPGKILRSPGN